ncbi:MAG: hypothetical protein HYR83_13755 [Planctomycetes bacterium]|nr:hypothetical protein [Planctomycetota bacterium]
MPEDPTTEFTRLLEAAAGGREVLMEAFSKAQAELRYLARIWMSKTPPGQTLQPTALVHEALRRLLGKESLPTFENRRHFFFVASRAMHDVLVKREKRKGYDKRSLLSRIRGCKNGLPRMETPDLCGISPCWPSLSGLPF